MPQTKPRCRALTSTPFLVILQCEGLAHTGQHFAHVHVPDGILMLQWSDREESENEWPGTA